MLIKHATDTLPQTPHRAGALCTGYALSIIGSSADLYVIFAAVPADWCTGPAGHNN